MARAAITMDVAEPRQFEYPVGWTPDTANSSSNMIYSTASTGTNTSYTVANLVK